MTYEELSNRNTSEGLHVLVQYVSDVVPMFIPMVLFSFFIIVLGGIYFNTRREGKPDFFSAFAVAGYATLLVALVLSVIPGVIDMVTIGICVIITIAGTLGLWMHKKD